MDQKANNNPGLLLLSSGKKGVNDISFEQENQYWGFNQHDFQRLNITTGDIILFCFAKTGKFEYLAMVKGFENRPNKIKKMVSIWSPDANTTIKKNDSSDVWNKIVYITDPINVD